MTEPESKPSPEALALIPALMRLVNRGAMAEGSGFALALDAAIAAGAEAALRRQAEVKQPGEEPAMAIAREGIRRVAKERDEALANYREAVSATERVIVERDEARTELATEKAAHEATKELLANAVARADRAAIRHERCVAVSDAAHAELAALRKPLDEGKPAHDLRLVGNYLRACPERSKYHTTGHRSLALEALSRIEAALQAKGEPGDISATEKILLMIALARGYTPNLGNQVELDKLCHQLALEHRAKHEPQPPADVDTSETSYKRSDYEQLGPVCSPDEAAARIAWGKAERAKMMKPPAETPEPRAIVPGSVWRSDVLGYERTVRCVMVDGVSFVDKSGGTDVWPPSMFRARHAHVSDPEPAAPAPLPEPGK